MQQLFGFIGRDMIRGKIDHDLIDHGYQVTTNCPVVRSKFYALRRRFDQGTAGEVDVGIVAK